MSTAAANPARPSLTDERPQINDCWNQIGVRGDASCSELRTHIHCRNCDVYSRAARQLLDVPLPNDHLAQWTKHFATPHALRNETPHSALIVRCDAEWLALPTALCVEVAASRPIHSVPHRRDPSVLGLVNVRGELTVCLSLAVLLGRQRTEPTSTRRLIVINDGAPTALEVDEVHTTHRFGPKDLAPLPSTLSPSTRRHTSATLRWRDHTVGVLDEAALTAGISRSLA